MPSSLPSCRPRRSRTGEWFTVTAGCDYTGWGCQQWGQAYVDSDLDAILRLGLSDEDRKYVEDLNARLPK